MIRSSLVGAALLLTSTAALAGATRSIRQTTAKDFEEGEATASMILPTGDVVPGMKTSRIPLDASFAWCAALSPDGKTAYFGTGDQGRIFSVPMKPSGSDAAARKLAEVDAAWVTSLAVRPDGTIIAGTTPGGRVFSIDPRTGTSRLLAKLVAEHVWALVLDKSGTVYAATGGPGKIFAIDPKGAARVHWDSGDKQIVSLADGGGGTLLAGTSTGAIVYRIRANGRAEALHDFEADEVRAVARTGTTTYLVVNDFEKGGELSAPAGGPTPAKGTRITAATGGAPASVGGVPRPGQVKAKAGVYRLEDDGQIEQIFSLGDGYFTSLLLGEGGSVYVAAGTQGKLYRIGADRTTTLAADLPERQALSMVRNPEGFLVGTGDVAGIYRVRPAAGGEATYLSKVFDAEVPARWGHLRWSGSKDLVFETRSGNTAKPDKSWTDWRKLDGVSHGGVEGEGHIASAGSRYLQYRLALPGKGSILRETTVYYLPQNQRARITELTGEPAGSARTHSPVLKLRWKVENPDADELIYRLWFRQENESVWRPLGGPDPLTKTEYDWNTESVPDGRYVVRVWASDERVTPHDRALDASYESPPFLVDNTKPEVSDLKASPPTVTGRVKDEASPISQIEYSIDGTDWRPATPTDGLLDQRSEAFTLKLPTLAPGPHVVTVRAFDSAENIGSARVTFTIGK